MKMIVKSNEINKVAKILANNNFTNVKQVNNLERYLMIYLHNYYILSLKKNFKAVINYNKDVKDYTNILYNLISDFNFLFDEMAEIKKEDIEVEIICGGEND